MGLNKFRTKARAVELLGRKQIRDDITALIELMKNSFDADADSLLVEFKLNETSSPYLIIYDDGHGMTQQELLEKWLVIGTDSKKTNTKIKKSRNKKRTLMGEKGIGRLASAALGEQFCMFTKSLENKWSAIYLNWNIFENTDFFLDDISIPTMLNRLRSDILSKESIEGLVGIQKENLTLNGWFEETGKVKEKHANLYKRIDEQINQFSLPLEHLESVVNFLDDIGQGTILVIQDLRQRWNDVFDLNTESSDIISKSRYDRLGTFVDSFRSVDPEFEVLIYADNRPIEFSYDFDEELYDIYDLKIKGEIHRGNFKGSLLAPSADVDLLSEINEELSKGIDVTNGITNPLEKDCGKFKLELCHFEMDKKNSSVNDEDRAKLMIRLEKAGGVKVFRDGVRVLPYGDAENDFLNLEMRRSKNAGVYLFSHRNMFGKILITSEENPELEDKSSREGLLENEQYYYFINTLQNLLIKIAFDFLTDRRANSKKLRSTYLSKNNLEYDKKEKEQETIKKEATAAKKELSRLKKEFEVKSKGFSIEENKKFSPQFAEVPAELKYRLLSEKYELLKRQLSTLSKELEEKRGSYIIVVNPRYTSYIEEEFLEEIYLHNTKVEEFFSAMSKRSLEKYEALESQLKFKLNKWKKVVSNYLDKDFDRYVSFTHSRIQFIKESLNKQLYEFEVKINNRLYEKKKSFDSIIPLENVLSGCKEQLLSTFKSRQSDIIKQLSETSEILSDIHTVVPNRLKLEADKLEQLLSNIEESADVGLQRFLVDALAEIDRVLNDELSQIVVKLSERLGYLSEDSEVIGILSQKISALERENEIYSDLANMGMAAEIVNHEFNQLFTNVNDAIKNLRIGSNSTQRYWVEQIESGFKAISARHTQLSPMYRSYNLKKRPVSLYEIVGDMLTFFESRIRKSQIEIVNEIDSEFMINLSPSKVYPVFSNIIDNAIYWVLNQEIKTIHFRSNMSNNAIYIEDSGPGISSRSVFNIFEPFYTARPQGRGLGLTIVKKVLESQGHQINVILNQELKRLKGACFEIIFNDADKVGTTL